MNKLLPIIIIILLILGLSPIGSTVDINGVKLQSSGVTNLTVTTNTSLDFSTIKITSTYIQLNDTKINGTYPNTATIMVMYLDNDILNAAEGEEVMDFYATMTSGSATFKISGLEYKFGYNVTKAGASIATPSADDDGFITFTTTVGTNAHFEILRGGTTSQWVKYYGNQTGTNFTINTYDVIKIYLDDGAGTILINMTANPDITYNQSRNVSMTMYDWGYNYTGFTNYTSSNLSNIYTAMALSTGYFLALWNETTYTWNFHIGGFTFLDKQVHQYDVIVSKISTDRYWEM